MKKRMTQEYLKECITYDQLTGIFVWKTRPESHFSCSRGFNMWNTKYSNKKAGNTKNYYGYHLIGLDHKIHFAHKLAFLYMEGYFPEHDIDHIDRDRLNNKWSNLREVSHQCNAQNCKLSKNNTSGVCGVCWSRQANKWMASIVISGRDIYLGIYKNFNDAVMARYKEEVENPNWTCSIESSAYLYLKDRNLI